VSTVAAEPTAATDMRRLLRDDTPGLLCDELVADRYRVEGILGTGGMAHVVRATDLVLHREVAVKLLRETTDTEGDLARFLTETRTLARLSHPGLVTLLDGGTTASGRPYLVMELVDGPALSASLEAPLDPVRVAEVGAQVAAALAYAHAQGVVHRDVKPGNVLLRGDGRVKLADFGIAKLLGDQSLHTRTGTVLGSVHYLAPEQVAFEEITPAVDVYALGLLMLRCLTGHHAFDGPTIESALARLSADPEVPADLPPAWRDLLTAMTRRVPEARPSAAEVADRLAWLSGARATTRVVPLVPAVGHGSARRRRVLTAARGWLGAARSRISASPAAVGAAVLSVTLLVAAAVTDDGAASDEARTDAPAAQADTEPPVTRAEPRRDAVVPAVDLEPATVPDNRPRAGTDTTRSGTDEGADARKDDDNGKGKGKGKSGKGKPGKGKGR
jgi:tRNA A-37 threonylcarbamoyl transferase component Bud32